MKPLHKKGLITIIIYAILVVTAIAMNNAYPTGSCGPGFGLLYIILVCPCIASFFFVKEVYFLIRGSKDVYLSLIIHLLILALVLIRI